jgi:hypothetical protein
LLTALSGAFAHRDALRDAFVAFDAVYRPRNPQQNPVYGVVAGHLETFLVRQRERERNVPGFVEEHRRFKRGTGSMAAPFRGFRDVA